MGEISLLTENLVLGAILVVGANDDDVVQKLPLRRGLVLRNEELVLPL